MCLCVAIAMQCPCNYQCCNNSVQIYAIWLLSNHVKLKWMTPSSIIYLIMTDSQHCVSIIYELCGQCIVLL